MADTLFFKGPSSDLVREWKTVGNEEFMEENKLLISSPAFRYGDDIPDTYTCDGENINPPLRIGGVPKEAKSLVLVVDDPDAPGGTFDHWVVWNIPPGQREIRPGDVPGKTGRNSRQRNDYIGPCPPGGLHHYYFKLYALDTMLNLDDRADKKTVEEAMDGHILATGKLMGVYAR